MRGAILLLALAYLLLLALVAAAVVHSAAHQLRRAGNEQFAVAAQLYARAVATAVARRADNFDVAAEVGAVRCPAADPGRGCDTGGLAPLPATLARPGVDYRVIRRAPVALAGVLLAGGEPAEPAARFGLYEVHVRVADGAARGEAIRGLLLGLPAEDAAAPPAPHAGELYGVYWRSPAVDPL